MKARVASNLSAAEKGEGGNTCLRKREGGKGINAHRAFLF